MKFPDLAFPTEMKSRLAKTLRTVKALINELLSVRPSLSTKDMLRICSNMCLMLKPTVLPIMESATRLSITNNDPGYHPTNFMNHMNVAFLHDDFMCKRKKFSTVLDVNKLADSDNERVFDLNANECRKDGSRRSSSRRCVSRRAMGYSATCWCAPSTLSSRGTSPCGCPRRPVT